MAKEAKNIITTICDEQCTMSDKVSILELLEEFIICVQLYLLFGLGFVAVTEALCVAYCTNCEPEKER